MTLFTKKRIFKFMPGLLVEGGINMKNVLGGKGASLCEMAKIGAPVPPGFVITTDTCIEYYSDSRALPEELLQEIILAIKDMEKLLNKIFGKGPDPLLVSCRSGARLSMPGMMDTVLNIGFTPDVLEALKLKYSEIFALDTYRRFLHMYGSVVLGIDEHHFKKYKNDKNDVSSLKKAVTEYEHICSGLVPTDPMEQLFRAVASVFDSWHNERANVYRRTYSIPDEWGTAASVVAMVYGNKDKESGTGVVFTRNPATGENKPFGEYLALAQGEDVVRGSVTPTKLEELKNTVPTLFNEIEEICEKFESYFNDVQDIEFTVESGKLWILQTRSAKRTARAAVKIAHDLYVEGKLDCELSALKLIPPEDLEQFLSPCFDEEKIKNATPVARGIAASPGAASGKIVFTAKRAVELKQQYPNENFVLVRPETVPDDISGMKATVGFLTAVGGASSHAALVARQMGKPCIVGCSSLVFKEDTDQTIKGATLEGVPLYEMDFISFDGQSGNIYCEMLPTVIPDPDAQKSEMNAFNWVMETCDIRRRLGVWANADSAEQCKLARKLGAEGIGLCRTEHQFFDAISEFQAVLLSEDLSLEMAAKESLRAKQTQDFYEMFKEMNGLPVTIRLLDPPLHEFLPTNETAIEKVSQFTKIPFQKIKDIAARMTEANPMLGFRGCRLGIIKSELTRLQIEAIFLAAKQALLDKYTPVPYIMVPLAGSSAELKIIYNQIHEIAGKNFADLQYQVGAMIELPRACLVADDIASISDFISFGTNDLTQTTMGISRDDCAAFMETYLKLGIYARDPFQSIDLDGVGVLIKMAVAKARTAKPGIKIGICGEHGGDPNSINFFRGLGFDYVSCAPKRIPTAKLAAIL